MNISLQLYSLREDEEESFEHALEMTAQAGYQGVEFAGYFDKGPVEMHTLLERNGLKAVSTHAGFQRFTDAFDEELAWAKTLNYKLIVCPGMDYSTKEATVKSAGVLEECAKKAAKDGITVGYHNHSGEFKKFDDEFIMDLILKTAPHVKYEPDLCWIANAGVDPTSYVGPYAKAGRICAVHAKELGKDGKIDAYVGEGKVDFKAIARLCPPDKYPWIVEQEAYHSSHLDGITICCKNLRAILESI
jgi:sugar phosphate isomerase/epimerase